MNLQSSTEWVAEFQQNAASLLEVPWGEGVVFTPAERELVAASLPAWQLGESSDGLHLLGAAKRYAAQKNDPDFVDAIQLFIREEQRHGADLGRVLDLAGIPRKTWDWGDTVFRLFRHLRPRIELTATVVIAVEILALLYYAAVRRSVSSPVLRRVCEQILRDEPRHLRFQCERMAMILDGRPPFLRGLTLLGQRFVFLGTMLAVWLSHRRVLKADGYTFRRYWRNAWGRFDRASRTWRCAESFTASSTSPALRGTP